MTRMSEVYHMVCMAADTEQALRGLDDEVFRMFCAWLRKLPLSGIPGQIHGLAMVEATERFMKQGGAR